MRSFIKRCLFSLLSGRTIRAIRFDLWRLKARIRNHRRKIDPAFDRLHLGCGSRKIPEWLNVDVCGSDFDVDLAKGFLPFNDNVFAAVVSQHVIEHLELTEELLPLLEELHRCCRPGAIIWLSCPDLEKTCQAYFDDKGQSFVQDRMERFPGFDLNDAPSQQIINLIFVQDGEHRNLLDFELLTFLLKKSGFSQIERRTERDLLEAHPHFPKRNDDLHSIYVSAQA